MSATEVTLAVKVAEALNKYNDEITTLLQAIPKLNLPTLVKKAKGTGLEEFIELLTEMMELANTQELISKKKISKTSISYKSVVAHLHSANLQVLVQELKKAKVKQFAKLLKKVAIAKDIYMEVYKILSAIKALKHYENMISSLQDTDLRSLIKNASDATYIPQKVKDSIDLVDSRVSHPVVCRYLMLYVNKMIESSHILFEDWLKMVSKYGGDRNIINQARHHYAKSLKNSGANLKFDACTASSDAGDLLADSALSFDPSSLGPARSDNALFMDSRDMQSVRALSLSVEALPDAESLGSVVPMDDEAQYYRGHVVSKSSKRKLFPKVKKIFNKLKKKSVSKPVPESLKVVVSSDTMSNTEEASPGNLINTEEEFAAGMKGCLTPAFHFEDRHISALTEVLAAHSSKWRDIAISLQLPYNEIRGIESMIHMYGMIGCLNKVLHLWVMQECDHSKPPTLNSLETTLRSTTVGLGVEANNLQANLVRLGILSSRHDDSVQSSDSENSSIIENESISIISQSHGTKINEGKCALFEVVVSASSETSLSYQWYRNGKKLNDHEKEHKCHGSGESIVSIYVDDLIMEGSSYTCEIQSSLGETLETNPIILDVETPLDQYRSKLTDIYTAQPEVPTDSWPPVNKNTYINLALIKQEALDNAGEYARCTIRGDADDIFKDKVSIPFEKAFENIGAGTHLMIEGRPGSGKTTLVHKISQDWAKDLLKFSHIKLLFLIHLRGFVSDPAIKLRNILECYYEDDTESAVDDIMKYAHKRSGLGLCFILDGLDEYLPQNNNAYIFKLIKKLELPKAAVIIASRPVAAAKFRDLANTQIEVLGFFKDQIYDYIEKYRFSVKSKCDKLHEYLDYHPNVHHMCYLPIHTAMICFLFDRCGNDLPETESGIYKEFTKYTLLRTLCRYNEDMYIESIKSLSDLERIPYEKICKLAFKMTASSKQVVMEADVKDFFDASSDKDSLGLITVDKMASRCGSQKLYTFLHLTFQEFLAAYYIFNLDLIEQTELVRTYGKAEQMKTVWKFYCGLSEFDDQYRFEELMSDTQYGTLYKVQCSFESQQPSTCNYIIENSCLLFKDDFLTPTDFTAIAYVISSDTPNVCSCLSFDACTIGQEGIDALVKKTGKKLSFIYSLCYHGRNCVTEQLHLVTRLLNRLDSLEILDITNTYLGNDEVKALTDNISHSNLQVVKIDSTGNNPLYSSDDVLQLFVDNLKSKCSRFLNIWFGSNYTKQYLVSTLIPLPFYFHNMSGLNDVSMCNSKLQPVLVKVLLIDLKRISVCRKLSLVNCSIDDEGARVLSNGIKYTSIKELQLSINLISDDGALALAGSIESCLNLRTLNLSCNLIGDEGAMAITNCVKDIGEFELLLWNNNITKHGADALFLVKIDVIIDTLDIKNVGSGNSGIAAVCSHLTACSGSNVKPLSDTLEFNDLSNLHTINLSNNCVDSHGAKILASSLINCYNLLTFDISCNRIGTDGATAIVKVLKHCRTLNISENSIDFDKIDEEGAEALASALKACDNLHELNISHNNLYKLGCLALAKALKRCTELHTLIISNSALGNDGVKVLADGLKYCTDLHTLDIGNNYISKIAFYDGVLGDMFININLQEFNISHNALHSDGAKALADVLKHCHNLHTLNIDHNNIGNDGAEALSNVIKYWSKLHKLHVSGNNIHGDHLAVQLRNHRPDLHAFYFDGNRFGNDGANSLFAYLKYCNNLHTLDISHNHIGKDGALALAKIFEYDNHLHTLNLSYNDIQDDGVKALSEHLGKHSFLHTLRISGNCISNDGAKFLFSTLGLCVNLHVLDVSSNDISKDGVKALADVSKQWCNLSILDISYNNCRDAAVAVADIINNCDSLCTLNISYSDICDSCSEAIAEHVCNYSHLRILKITGNYISTVGAKSLSGAITHCSNLHTLELSNNKIGADGMRAFSDVTQHFKNLHTLKISSNNFGQDGAKALADALINCNVLQTLDIQHNKIYEDGAKALADGLKHCSNLHTLDISYNSIGKEGMEALNDGIKHCSNLHTLIICGNNIGDGAIKTFANIMKHISNLHKLDISKNSIGPDGAIALTDGLKHCNNLVTLTLDHNIIADVGARALVCYLRHCSTLRYLNMRHCGIGYHGAIAFKTVFNHFLTLHLTGNKLGNDFIIFRHNLFAWLYD